VLMSKYVYSILSFLIFAFTFSSCSDSTGYSLKSKYTDKPSYGDTLVDSSIGEPSTLNPVLASDSASHDIIDMIYNGLVKFDKDLKLTGDLAESWEISKDNKTIVFHLKKNVLWQDGVEFTSRDVKFTYDMYMDPGSKTAYRSLFEPVKSVTTPDRYTVKVTYSEVFAPALQYWGTSIIPAHLLEGRDINTAAFNRSPVGTGIFRLKKWETAQHLELIKNDRHFAGRPFLDRYIYKIIPDQSVQFMELKAGTLDMMGLTPDIYLTQAEKAGFKKNFNKYKITTFSYVYMGFNMANPLFKDKMVRQALSYAINRDEIIAGVRRGLARKISGPFIPGTGAYNDKAEGYDYNLEKASELLANAGWKKNKEGILEKEGKKFEFTVITNQGNKEREQIASIIQQQFAGLGIKVNVRVLAWNIMLAEFIDKRKFDAVVMGWNIGRDPDCYDIWHSSKTAENEFNFVSYSNKQVDKLLIKGRSTFDQEQRNNAYRAIHALIAEDAPYIFLYTPYALPAVHKRVHGIAPAAAGIGYNFREWYVPAELVKYRSEMAK
jgi:peptide/nickel transport system substrate-binding protein